MRMSQMLTKSYLLTACLLSFGISLCAASAFAQISKLPAAGLSPSAAQTAESAPAMKDQAASQTKTQVIQAPKDSLAESPNTQKPQNPALAPIIKSPPMNPPAMAAPNKVGEPPPTINPHIKLPPLPSVQIGVINKPLVPPSRQPAASAPATSGSQSYPILLRATPMRVTGTGQDNEQLRAAAYVPRPVVTLRSAAMRATGTGQDNEEARRAAYVSRPVVTLRAAPMQVTGTGLAN